MARILSVEAQAEMDKSSARPRWLVELLATEKDGTTTTETRKFLSTTNYHGPSPENALYWWRANSIYRTDADGTTLLGAVGTNIWDACCLGGKVYFAGHTGHWWTWDGTTLTDLSDSGPSAYFGVVYDGKIWTSRGVHIIGYSDDGGATWTTSTDTGDGSIVFDGAVYKDKLYVAQWRSGGGRVFEYDKATGIWTRSEQFSGRTYCSSLKVYRDTLFALVYDTVWEFDGTTWVQNTDMGTGSVDNAYDRLAVYRDKLYRFWHNTGSSKIFVYDGTDWALSTDLGVATRGYRAAVWDDKLYWGFHSDADHELIVFDGTSWTVSCDSAQITSALYGAQKYENLITDLGDVEQSVTPGGGYGEISDFSFSVANGKVEGETWSSILDTYGMTNNEVSLSLVFANGAETEADHIPVFKGYVRDVEYGYETMDVHVIDGSKRKLKKLLRETLDFGLYPNAPLDRIGEPLPVVFGDFSDDPLRFVTDHQAQAKSLSPGIMIDFASGQYLVSASPAIGGLHNLVAYYDDVHQYGEALEWETLSRSHYVFTGADDKVYSLDSASDSTPAYTASCDISSYGTDIRAMASYRGEVYAGGSCGTGGLLLRWDGTAWAVVNNALENSVDALYEDRGKLWIGTSANIRHYDGASITSEQVLSEGVKDITRFRGRLFLGTDDGKVWERYPEATEWVVNTDMAVTGVNALVSYQGNLYAGTSDSNGKVWKYDGDTWSVSCDFASGSCDIWALQRYLLGLYAAVDDKIYKFDNSTWTLATDMSAVCDDVYSLGTRYTDASGNYAFMLLAGTSPNGRVFRAADPSGTWSLVCDFAESDVKAFGQWIVRPTYQISGMPRRMAVWPLAPLSTNDIPNTKRFTLIDRSEYVITSVPSSCDVGDEWDYLFPGVGQPLGTIEDLDFRLGTQVALGGTVAANDFAIVLSKDKQGTTEWSTSVTRGGNASTNNDQAITVDIDHTVFDEAWDFENLTAKVTSQYDTKAYSCRHMYMTAVYTPAVSPQTGSERLMASLEGYVDQAGNYTDGAVVDTARKVLESPPAILEAIARNKRMLGLSKYDVHQDSFDDAETDLSGWEFAFVLNELEEPEDFLSRYGEAAKSHIFWAGDGRLKWQTFLSTRAPVQTFGTWNIQARPSEPSTIHFEVTPMSELRNSNYVLYRKSYDAGNYEGVEAETCSIIISGTGASIADGQHLVDANATFFNDGAIGAYSTPGKLHAFEPVLGCYVVGGTDIYTLKEVVSNTTLNLFISSLPQVYPVPVNGTNLEYYVGPSLSSDNVESYRRYGSEFEFRLETDLIRDTTTAENLVGHQSDYFRLRHYVATFEANLSAADLEVGDLVWIDHPLLPTGQAKVDTTSDLAEAIDTTETEWDVDDGADFAVDSYYIVDREVIKVSGIAVNTLTVARAQCGTVAAAHSSGQDVYRLATKWEVIRQRWLTDDYRMELTCREV